MASSNLCAGVLLQLVLLTMPSLSAPHGILTTLPNPFVGGPVGSCEVPSTPFCEIDYPVPTTIARVAALIEENIRNVAGFRHSSLCERVYIRTFCTIRFPRCVGLREGSENIYSHVELNNQDCSEVRQACATRPYEATVLEMICNGLPNATVPAAGCRPVRELVGNFSFEYSELERIQNALVTDWMLAYIKYFELASGGIIYNDPNCGRGLATFMSRYVGQCTADQSSIVLTNTHEYCNSVLYCYGDALLEYVDDEINCDMWPQEHLMNISIDPISTTTIVDIHAGRTDIDVDYAADQISSAYTVRQETTCLALYLLTTAGLFIFMS